MSLRRKILTVLLVVPLALLLVSLLQQNTVLADRNSPLELAYLCVGVPVAVLAAWEWTAPHILDALLPGKPHQDD
jgi:hypothetical protein